MLLFYVELHIVTPSEIKGRILTTSLYCRLITVHTSNLTYLARCDPREWHLDNENVNDVVIKNYKYFWLR